MFTIIARRRRQYTLVSLHQGRTQDFFGGGGLKTTEIVPPLNPLGRGQPPLAYPPCIRPWSKLENLLIDLYTIQP